VIEICRAVGNGEVDQRSAQAATWHYTDNLSWEFLASKVGYRGIDGTRLPFFNADQLQAGMKIASLAASYAHSQKSAPASEGRESTGSNYGKEVSTAAPVR
jgi:hypothetical protein